MKKMISELKFITVNWWGHRPRNTGSNVYNVSNVGSGDFEVFKTYSPKC